MEVTEVKNALIALLLQKISWSQRSKCQTNHYCTYGAWVLSIDEVKFGMVLDELPVRTSGRTITMDVDSVDTCHVDEAGDTQVEQEVHRTAAEPDQVRDVRDQLIVVVARLRTSYLWRAVEDGACPVSYTHLTLPTIYSV